MSKFLSRSYMFLVFGFLYAPILLLIFFSFNSSNFVGLIIASPFMIIIALAIKLYDGGPVGLDTLSAAVGEESVTIEDVYEPYLMQIGFLSRTSRGRCVTGAAYKHLNIEKPGQQTF